MPSLKEVRNRIQSVVSTQQITKAMKMVAAAKLRRAQDAITQMRPYSEKLTAVINNVASNLKEGIDNPFAEQREGGKILILLVTSDRGLCGAFNSNVVKGVMNFAKEEFPSQWESGAVTLLPIGKKGYEFYQRRNAIMVDSFVHSFDGFNFSKASAAAEFAMDAFRAGEFNQVFVVYNEFKNVATQVVKVEQVLPLMPVADNNGGADTEYIFEPSAEYVMQEVVPTSIKIQIFKAMLESNASEHGARMTAMDKATENAGELLKDLRLTYNRSRQAAITKEILEIVGGAEALGK